MECVEVTKRSRKVHVSNVLVVTPPLRPGGLRSEGLTIII